jgi:cell division protein FtsN
MASRNVKNFEFKLGKLGLLLFTGGMAVLVFVVFLFGVRVGKNMDTYPQRYSREIPDMIRGWLPWTKGEKHTAARNTAGSTPAKQDGNFDLTFYDTLSKKPTDAKSSPAGGIAEEAPAGESPKVLVPPASPPPEKKTPEANRQPLPPQPPAGGVSPQAVPPQSKERYLIQVASYREKGKAEALRNKIKALGYNTRVTMITLPSRGKWFRVILDGIEGREQAEEVAGLLPGKVGAVNCIIRRAAGN